MTEKTYKATAGANLPVAGVLEFIDEDGKTAKPAVLLEDAERAVAAAARGAVPAAPGWLAQVPVVAHGYEGVRASGESAGYIVHPGDGPETQDKLVRVSDVRAAALAARANVGVAPAPAGDWLWVKFMDWCKKRHVHPGDYNDLFAIVGEAREANDHALTLPPSVEAHMPKLIEAAEGDKHAEGWNSAVKEMSKVLRVRLGSILAQLRRSQDLLEAAHAGIVKSPDIKKQLEANRAALADVRAAVAEGPTLELTDQALKSLGNIMPMKPWGIGSRPQDAVAFARAAIALSQLAPAKMLRELSEALDAFDAGGVSEAKIERINAARKAAREYSRSWPGSMETPVGRYSFDDMNIGRAGPGNRALATREIPRPPGFQTNADWYAYAKTVCDALNTRDAAPAPPPPNASLRAEVTGHSCCIDVTKNQMLKLLDMGGEEVAAALENAGADKGSIEYDGHFGAHVFFEIDEGKDPQAVATALQDLLAEPVAKPAKKGFTP